MKQIIALAILLLGCGTIFADAGRIPIFEPVELDGTMNDDSERYRQ